MEARSALLAASCALWCALAGSLACAQVPIGSVSTLDATVTGANSVANDRAQLGTNGTVVAKDHVAYVQLLRGGSVKVCATSGVHLTAGTAAPAAQPVTAPLAAETTSGAAASRPLEADATGSPAPADAAAAAPANAVTTAAAPATPATMPITPAATMPASPASTMPPLMVALDRGAMELRMSTVPGDIVMTPDLRFSFNGDGQLDVRIRVTRNGDTCIENRVAGLSGHPELKVGSLFGNESYNIMPGQHVLFEGGSLREVVDNESSPCGCPDDAVKPPSLAEVLPKKDAKTSSSEAAAQHPFPADVSQGLAPSPPVPQAPPQVTHTQVATTLVYSSGAPDATAKKDDTPMTGPPVQKKGFFHSVGRFFKKVF